MSLGRAVAPLRATLSSTSVASSSRRTLVTRSPTSDRYLAIHAFFTRQLSPSTARLAPAIRTQIPQRRWNSSEQKQCANCDNKPTTSASTSSPQVPKARKDHAQDYAPFIRRLIASSSVIKQGSPHRPTKEELLGAASGWWQRLRIRIKWFTIRGWRRFNMDDLSAFASWFVVGNTLWILIGTTTFVSAVFATLNSLSLQEYVARWISDYLTSETGMNVIFESAIVPKWKASTITFKNVYISRRPTDPAEATDKKKRKTAKATPPSQTPFLASTVSPETYLAAPPASETDNYTMFDINIDEVDVTLSFMRWLDGKGLVKDASVKGVRGVVDRRSVWWDTSKPMLPEDFRHATHPGDFELESLHIEDSLITIYQPGGQRPYNYSIFNAVIGPFRKRWLFYDLMCAESITGQMDNCLFSLHMPQKLGKVSGDEGGQVKRMARFRIDGLPIEHAQYATGHTGPMSWITSGRLDAVLDIKFPYHPEESLDLRTIFDQIGRNVATITASGVLEGDDVIPPDGSKNHGPKGVIPGNSRLARPPLRTPKASTRALPSVDDDQETKREVTVDIDLRFRDLKAAVPMFTADLSVANNAFIRPIVAFINANRTLLPIHCQVAADLSDFDGSWTLFETGLMTSVSDQIYDALAHHVSSESANVKRIRQVSFWGIQKGAEVLLDTLRNVVDPLHSQLAPAI